MCVRSRGWCVFWPVRGGMGRQHMGQGEGVAGLQVCAGIVAVRLLQGVLGSAVWVGVAQRVSV